MASREIVQVFEEYQQSRIKFVQAVADFASRPRHIEALQNVGVMELIRPLLIDHVPSIQASAALALGRLANHSDELAESVVSGEVLPQLVYGLSERNRYYKKSAAFVIRAVAKHSSHLAQAVVDSGAIESLVQCLEDFDPAVKESAAWALGYIARHNAELAQSVVDNGAVPFLVICVQEPEVSLKRIAASALSDISKHSLELAQTVVDAEAIPNLAVLIQSPDAKLKKQVTSCLAQIAKHNVELAELVVEAEIFPKIFTLLKDSDEIVRKNACTCIREIVKHTPELAELVVSAGGLGPLIDYVGTTSGNARLPGIMTLGFIAAFSETLALSVVTENAIPPLTDSLVNEVEDHIKSASAWSLGQIGRHNPGQAKAVADKNVLKHLLDSYMSEEASEDLRKKSKKALKGIVQKCLDISALLPLLHHTAPPNILKAVVGQCAKILVLPEKAEERKLFVTEGALAELQEIEAEEGSELKEHIQAINEKYPDEVVKYYSPGYSQELLQKLS
eukprot:gb/GECH01012987.1/.p1 GENE.gb/GECH01012987.1/~~gb/GECH01012987.1/.p1  ORF type:complete len:506 (+),score=126.62 gb/GECH01012987.1/:1-1518(+)